MKDVFNGMFGGLIFAFALVAFFAFVDRVLITPELNTVTIHKTQDRLPVACQEGAQ